MSIKQNSIPIDAQNIHNQINDSISLMFQGSNEPNQPRQGLDHTGVLFNQTAVQRPATLTYGETLQPFVDTYSQIVNDSYSSDYNHESSTDGNTRFTPRADVHQYSPRFISSYLPPGNQSAHRRMLSTGPLVAHNQADTINSASLSSENIESDFREPQSRVKYPIPIKPKIATTFWEDENTLCYQVEARGVLVSRREDTDFVNGTKLLNAAGMSRGKRDGILKSERIRTVVKVGGMNLKGIWIPYERAKEIARNEGVDNFLFPLFVENIKEFYANKGSQLRNDGSHGDNFDTYMGQKFME